MKENKEDMVLVCKKCLKNFTWTKGEQEFFDMLFTKGKIQSIVAPKRCSPCRIEYKAYKDNFKTQPQSYL